MQKESCKGLASITLLVLLSMPLVSSANFLEDLGDNLKNLQDLTPSDTIVKVLFFILLTLLIWSALDQTKLIKKDGIRWLISGIVGFMGVFFLRDADFWGLMLTYSALGLTLLFIFPLIILLFFTLKVAEDGGPEGILFQKIMWYLYTLFLVYKLVEAVYVKEAKLEGFTFLIFFVASIVSIGMILFNKNLLNWVSKIYDKAKIVNLKRNVNKANRNIKTMSDFGDGEGI